MKEQSSTGDDDPGECNTSQNKAYIRMNNQPSVHISRGHYAGRCTATPNPSIATLYNNTLFLYYSLLRE